MLTMLQIRFKEYKRAWLSFVMMTLMSIAFIYAFGLGFGNETRLSIAMVNESDGAMMERIILRLQENQQFEWMPMKHEEAIEAIKNERVIAAVILPENLEHVIENVKVDNNESTENPNQAIEIMLQTERPEIVSLRNSIRETFINELGTDQFLTNIEPLYEDIEIDYNKSVMREDILEFMEKRPAVTLDTSVHDSAESGGYNQLQQSFMGFMLFLSLFTMVFGVGGIVEDKELKIWHRQHVAPLSKWQIMGSVLIMGFIMGMFQLLLIVISGGFIFDIDLGPSLIGLILLLSGYTFAAIAMGLLVSQNVKTHQQLSAITPLIIVATSMLGGCMWPLEFVTNPVIRFLSLLTPQRYGMKGLEVLIVRQQGIVEMLPFLLKVLALGAVFLGLAFIPKGRSQENT